MIGQSGGLTVCFATDVTRVRLVMRVNHVMFVQTGILSEAFVTSGNLAEVRSFT